MASNIGWELYRSFLSVLTEGSLSGAARALGLTQPTVGRHIAALEKHLGAILFTRSQQGLMPTEIGLSLKTDVQAMANMAASLERAASEQGNGARGVVRISASEMIGAEVLPPIIARLHAQHPELKVELVLTNRVQDLLHREADIAVRMTRPLHAQLIARSIGAIELGLHAHADYLSRKGMPDSVDQLKHHVIIGYDTETPFIRRASATLGKFSRDTFSLLSDSDLAQLALIRSGAGIGFCQVPLAKRNAQLLRILPKTVSMRLETWVTMHEDLRNSPRCRAAFDALVEGLQDYMA